MRPFALFCVLLCVRLASAVQFPGYNEARGSCASPKQKCVQSQITNQSLCVPPASAFDAIAAQTGFTPTGAKGFRRVEYIPWANVWLAATYDAVAISLAPGIAARSTDDGVTWTFFNVTNMTAIRAIILVPEHQRVLMVGVGTSSCGVWSQNGVTWSQLGCTSSSFTSNGWESGVYVRSARRVLISRPTTSANQNSVAYSDDAGATWTLVSVAVGGNWRNMCYSPYLNRMLMASSAGRLIAYSDDLGLTWNSSYANEFVTGLDIWDCEWNPVARAFSIVASAGTTMRMMYSYDGITLYNVTYENGGRVWPDIKRVRYFEELGMLIAPVMDPDAPTYFTKDSVYWSSISTGSTGVSDGYDVAYNPTTGVLITVGYYATRCVSRALIGAPVLCAPEHVDNGTCTGGSRVCRGGVCVTATVNGELTNGSYYGASTWVEYAAQPNVGNSPAIQFIPQIGAAIALGCSTNSSVSFSMNSGWTMSSMFSGAVDARSGIPCAVYHIPWMGLFCRLRKNNATHPLVCDSEVAIWESASSSPSRGSGSLFYPGPVPRSSDGTFDIVLVSVLTSSVVLMSDTASRAVVTHDLLSWIVSTGPVIYEVRDAYVAGGTSYGDEGYGMWSQRARAFFFVSPWTGSTVYISYDGLNWRRNTASAPTQDIQITGGVICPDDTYDPNAVSLYPHVCYMTVNLGRVGAIRASDFTLQLYTVTTGARVIGWDPMSAQSLVVWASGTHGVKPYNVRNSTAFTTPIPGNGGALPGTPSAGVSFVFDPFIGVGYVVQTNGKIVVPNPALGGYGDLTCYMVPVRGRPPSTGTCSSWVQMACGDDSVCYWGHTTLEPSSTFFSAMHSASLYSVPTALASSAISYARIGYDPRTDVMFRGSVFIQRNARNVHTSSGYAAIAAPNPASNSTYFVTPSVDTDSGAIFVDVPTASTRVSVFNPSSPSAERVWQNATLDGGLKYGHGPVRCMTYFGTCVTSIRNAHIRQSNLSHVSTSGVGGIAYTLDRVQWSSSTVVEASTGATIDVSTGVRDISVCAMEYVRRFTGIVRRTGDTYSFIYSDDGGASWVMTTSYSESVFVNISGADAGAPDIVLNTDALYAVAVLGAQVMSTTDGIHWRVIHASLTVLGTAPYASVPYRAVYVSHLGRVVIAPSGFISGQTMNATFALSWGMRALSVHDDLYLQTMVLPAPFNSVGDLSYNPALYTLGVLTTNSTTAHTMYVAPLTPSTQRLGWACSATGVTSTHTVCDVLVTLARQRTDELDRPESLWPDSYREVVVTCTTGASATDPMTNCGSAFGLVVPCVPGFTMRNKYRLYGSINSTYTWMCAGVTTSGPTNGTCTASVCPGTAFVNRTTTSASMTETSTHTHYVRTCSRKYEQIPCTATCTSPSANTSQCTLGVTSGPWGTSMWTECVTGSTGLVNTACGTAFPDTNVTCVAGQRVHRRAYDAVRVAGLGTDTYAECAGAQTSSVSNSTCTGPAGYDAGTINETTIVATAADVNGFSTFSGSNPVLCTRTYRLYRCTTSAPIDCAVGAWSAYSACSHDCYGYVYRTRSITVPPLNGGAACPSLIEFSTCNTSPASCTTTSTYAVTNSVPPSRGTRCYQEARSVSLNSTTPEYIRTLVACTGAASAEHSFSNCGSSVSLNTTCASGTTNFRVSIALAGASNSSICTTAGSFAGAGTTSNVSGTCNATTCVWTGARLDSYYVRQTTAGWEYPTMCSVISDVYGCNNTAPCDCQVSAWSAWSACNATCGGGIRSRTRTVTNPGFNGGASCPATSETEACNTECCAVDCILGNWTSFGACNATCGGGYQTRTRPVIEAESCGGSCPSTSESRECNTFPCPINCAVSAWGAWSNCTKACGSGTRCRTRNVTTEPQFGGDACPDLVECEACNTDACPPECEHSAGPWSECSPSCGTRTRTRAILLIAGTPEACGGDSLETEQCDTVPCPVNCQLSNWTDWSACTLACGNGTQSRARTVVVAPQYGGTVCGALTETRSCNEFSCGVDCVLSGWSEWSACTASCGSGIRTRSRNVTTPSIPPGLPCDGAFTEIGVCNTQPCPIDCITSSWVTTFECVNATNYSVTCGSGPGVFVSNRTILQAPAFGGTECGSLSATTPCEMTPCASVDVLDPGDFGCYPNCAQSSSSSGSGSSSSSASSSASSSSEEDVIDLSPPRNDLDAAGDTLKAGEWAAIGLSSLALAGITLLIVRLTWTKCGGRSNLNRGSVRG